MKMARKSSGNINARGIGLCLLIGLMVGAGGFTFNEGEGLSYIGDEAVTCANCHIMREHYDAWQKSSHAAHATCNDCHVPPSLIPKYLAKAANGWNHSKAFTLQNFHDPVQIHSLSQRLVQNNCLRCHSGMVSQIVKQECRADTSIHCARCHDNVGHDPTR